MFRRLFILLACLVIGMVISSTITMFVGIDSAKKVRILTVIQDMFAFILPAVATAMLSSRLPARFLSIEKGFNIWAFILAAVLLVVSMPLQNAIIHWNESIALPESMSSLERWMMASEETARTTINMMMGGTTIGDLVMGILIVGILAAIGEELFFRGALQRILQGNKANAHAAIWIAAIIFSAFHFQFYGFVPRLLLGALFGYLVWWSGSLWLPIAVHALNNSIVVASEWHARCTDSENFTETLGTDSFAAVTVSALLTVATLILIRRVTRKASQPTQDSAQ